MANSLEDVLYDYQNNPEFREAFKKDPKEALKKWGYTLDKEAMEKLLKFKQDNEKLDERISK